MTQHDITTRRTVLSGIATGATVAVGGCLGSSGNDGADDEREINDDEIFEDIFVEETELVLEFAEEIDHVNIIDPTGEQFAARTIASGVDRETIEIGTGYEPGEYDIVALEDGEEQTTQSVTIEPDLRLTELRLARNHSDEMYDNARARRIRTEAIVTLENRGTGPDTATRLSFDGDVPRQTPSEEIADESGIYDTESGFGHADSVVLLPNEEVTLYSRREPFSSATEEISCTPDTEHGQFEVTIETAVLDEAVSETYAVSYTGEDLIECDIEIEEA